MKVVVIGATGLVGGAAAALSPAVCPSPPPTWVRPS